VANVSIIVRRLALWRSSSCHLRSISPSLRASARFSRVAGNAQGYYLDGAGKHISSSTQRFYQLRLLRIVIQLTAQTSDLDVHRPVEWARFPMPEQIQKLLPTQYPIGMVRKDGKQVELSRSQQNALAGGRQQLTCGWVEQPAGKP
jgi:hypothetical protein